MKTRLIAVLLGTAVLALPAAALAKPGHDKHPKKAKSVTFVFKGTFTAPGTLEVTAGNAHVRKGGYVGNAVSFDFASAKLVVADTDASGTVDIADVKDGDVVLVKARLPRRTEYVMPSDGEIAEAILARKLIDRTNPPVEDADTP